ncbi:MAG: DUF1330 domain-containing protein [Chloroflexi bacterium]|nr:DUF1330 domain-containing protein [Chloroflexota bacterium]OJV94051.1 MAG: hypothetical protein BGO39_06995 [Chloroflexi bacterium 54-19]
MAAYVVANIEVKDPEGYKDYSKLSRPAMEKYGGKALVRNGQVDIKEGTFVPKRFVILEFESMEQAQAYYNSPEYQAAKAIREKYAVTDFIIVEGA